MIDKSTKVPSLIPQSESSPRKFSKNKLDQMKKGFACSKGPDGVKELENKNINKEITDILQLLESKSTAR